MNVHQTFLAIFPKYIKTGAKLLRLEDAENFGAHSLRAEHITMLVNDPTVNIAEAQKSARHSSLSATLSYIRENADSETAKVVSITKGLAVKKRKFDSLEDERAPNLSCNFSHQDS